MKPAGISGAGGKARASALPKLFYDKRADAGFVCAAKRGAAKVSGLG